MIRSGLSLGTPGMTGGDTDVPKSTTSWEVFLNTDERGNQDFVKMNLVYGIHIRRMLG